MLPALVHYQDPHQNLGFSFASYNRFKSLGNAQPEDAYFDVPGGTYSFVPAIKQTFPGVFSLTYEGKGRFTGSNYGRTAVVELSGAVDENTAAVDLLLKADSSTFHLVIPASDTSGALALSKRIAADIQAKNWSDVYATSSPRLKQNVSATFTATAMTSMYRHVSRACRLGPAQLSPAQAPLLILGDHFADVLAVTVTEPEGTRVDTLATIMLNREEGTWVFVQGNPPGTTPGTNGPQAFGIPAPTP